MPRLVIHGAKGKMGQMVQSCAAQLHKWQIVGLVDLGDQLDPALALADVVIDFSAPEAVKSLALACASHGIPLVSGTTGLTPADRAALAEASQKVPIVWSSNFSTGVNVLFWISEQLARILGPMWDVEIVEIHHRQKKDSPSGTAQTLAEIISRVRGFGSGSLRYGRSGQVGPRQDEELGIHAVRGGDVIGDHTVLFLGIGERIELTHRAASRATFAMGALRAAEWVIGKRPALYDMRDVLGLH